MKRRFVALAAVLALALAADAAAAKTFRYAFQGDLKIRYSKDENLVRVAWNR